MECRLYNPRGLTGQKIVVLKNKNTLIMKENCINEIINNTAFLLPNLVYSKKLTKNYRNINFIENIKLLATHLQWTPRPKV